MIDEASDGARGSAADSAADARRAEIAGWFRYQAAASGAMGSALYEILLGALAERVELGDIDDLLGLDRDWRFGDAQPLRIVGAAHRLALSGRAPALASHFPSCRPRVDEAPAAGPDRNTERISAHELAQLAVDALRAHPEVLADYLARAVQTNEVARSGGLILGINAVAARFGLPICLVEIGTSAGLNLRLDRFAYSSGASAPLGDPTSTLRFDDLWAGPFPAAAPIRVERRIGLDPHPGDVSDPEQVERLCSYVWPDQLLRLDRLARAVEIAQATPAEMVDTAQPSAWLRSALPERSAGTAWVIQHSIVWQYVDKIERMAITEAIEAAAESATEDRPIAWVSYEPDDRHPTRAIIRLRTWPGGHEELIAHADYHGRWFHLPG